MSDLANSCEYFTAEKTCNLMAENAKAKANREVKCGNVEKTSCCYLCPTRPQCAASCKYLGSPDVAYVPVGPAKAQIENSVEKPEVQQVQHRKTPMPIANIQAKFCAECNTPMSEAKTELRVEGWKGLKPNMPSADMLPVVVYLCPNCGKIEFKAGRQTAKD